MNASIISIGQELLIGDTINTNASWLGTFLSENAINCRKVITIGDDAKMITRSLDQTLKSSDLVIVTGGLGPTHDDITKQAVAEYFDVGFVRHQPSYDQIKIAFKKRGIPFSTSNNSQADVLSNSEVLLNKVGTAPGMWIETKGRILVILPGVPFEMKYLMKNEVMPRLKVKNGGTPGYYSKYFQISGIGESHLSDDIIGDLSAFLSERVTLAYLPHRHYITLRLSSYASSVDEAQIQALSLEEHIRKTAGNYIYSETQEEKLESAVVELLIREKAVVATAESCSGGQLAHLLTNVSGCSSVFNGGVVVYSNEMKSKLLGIPENIISENGAVSKQVALAMAKSVAAKFNAQYGLSTTGIAGPTGGTSDKPVGTVWIGFWSENSHFAVKAHLFTERMVNKERSAVIALDILRRKLQKIADLPYDLKKVTAE
jgi:nicotinamide-nucleotide amidase